MADEQKKNKHAQNAEVMMWLVFICCGMVIAFVEKRPAHMFSDMQAMQEGRHDRVSLLIDYACFVGALWLCFPPLHRRNLQNSVRPFKDVIIHTLSAFLVVGAAKGVLIF